MQIEELKKHLLITAKPMTGTIKRGLTYAEDEDKKNDLFLSQKKIKPRLYQHNLPVKILTTNRRHPHQYN